jgi:hypothetical protein
VNLLKQLRTNKPADYQNYLFMDNELFQNLLHSICSRIEKKNTVMWDAVSAEERLSVTFRYLATGDTYQDLEFFTAISP